MARYALPILKTVPTGVYDAVTQASAFGANGQQSMELDRNMRRFLMFINNTGAAQTITIQTPGLIEGAGIAEKVLSMPTQYQIWVVGPFNPEIYAQPDGSMYIDYSTPAGQIGASALELGLI
jgi:hypothetical protein